MKEVSFQFQELTDLEMKVEFSKGLNVGEFKDGEECRELFILYKGPKFAQNKEEFFKQLNDWINSLI